jgi:molecular chaperone DnaK
MPQVDVTFDIDANGILNVSAKDKATGKEQKIVIKASSGLSDDEIDRMVSDAEAHAAEDKNFRELVETRNQGDALVHATEKMLQELGEKAEPEERAGIEAAISELKDAVGGDSKDVIEAKVKALSEASAGLAQKLYAEQTEEAGSDGGADESSGGVDDDNVVDAEFEEVESDDDEQKSA